MGKNVLPQGFSDLVGLVLEDWTWDELPSEDGEIWNALIYPIFLGATVRTAQANYIKECLWDFLECEAARLVPNDPIWSRRVMARVNQELQTIRGTPGEGLKRAILTIASKEIQDLHLSRTIGDALNFFNDTGLNAQMIIDLQNDYSNTQEIVDLAARSIHNVRYVKAVLWLYSCGIAEDLVPPNNHVTRFLDECGYPGFGWSSEPADDSQVFTPACRYMRDVAAQVGIDLNRTVTPKQAQAAVWYLQTCRGLLTTNRKRQFTPAALIDFLDIQRLTINQLNANLDDIENLENFSAQLNTFHRTM